MWNSNPSVAALVLRLTLGVMFIAHGLLKVLVFTMPGTVGFFESIGLPGLLAWVVTIGEIGGGLLLVLGVYTRELSVLLIPVLLGAAWVHLGNGWLFSAPGGGWEYPVFMAFTAAALALLDDGKLALGARLRS